MDKKGPGAIRGLGFLTGHPPLIDLTSMLPRAAVTEARS